MSQVAADLLARRYELRVARVEIIPHGIPDMSPRDQEGLKARFGVAGQRMLLTFGLLGPNKGVETVIRALPALVAAFPDLVYFVVGATHPAVLRQNGEAYRTSLERLAEQLGVREHVVFRDQYVTTEELCSYLQAADVFVSPYLNEAQVTSGALSYAMGAGSAVVSTPYWHAKELLAEGRGRLFPVRRQRRPGRRQSRRCSTIRRSWRACGSGPTRTRAPSPGRGRQAVPAARRDARAGAASARVAAASEPRASSLPELRLDHLLRLTDDTGIIQHATFSVPARAQRLLRGRQRAGAHRRAPRRIPERLGGDQAARRDLPGLPSRRADVRGPVPKHHELRPVVHATATGVRRLHGPSALGAGHDRSSLARRGAAHAGAADVRARPPPRDGARSAGNGADDAGADGVSCRATRRSGRPRSSWRGSPDDCAGDTGKRRPPDWRWFEPALTYDNALLPLALWRAHALTSDPESREVAREALEFLEATCFQNDRLVLVGNAGWHARGGTRPEADEQPTDAAAFVLAFRGAYLVTRDHRYLRRMREAFAWFLGANRLGAAVYDSATAGCRDGLGETAPNLNQGAESTISFLLSLIEMLELAGEGLEYADGSAAMPDA